MLSTNGNNITLLGRLWCWLHNLLKKLIAKVVEIATMPKLLAMDDPRRVIHSMKVGLALTLVSLFYYLHPIYDSFGDSAAWAIITVVVVFEFTVGATLGKGLQRVLATLTAVGLGVGTHHLACLCGKIGEAALIALFVFIFAAASTFIRFFPKIKARYDYGFLIFILTYSFITISEYRGVTEIIEIAHKRLSTIVIGGSVSLLINVIIFPVWAGEELHNSTALNMEKLAHFLEGLGTVYLKVKEGEANSKDGSKSSFQGYKNVLNSKSSEETLANFARWEPRHGYFKYRHPWNQYIKLGGLSRQCAYRIDALNAYLSYDIEIPQKFQEEIRDACTKMSLESSKTLKELGSCLGTMAYPSSSVNAHILSSKAAVESLKTCLKSVSLYNQHSELLEIIPMVTIAFLLIDIVDYTEKIAACAYELAILAHFKMVKVMDSKVFPEMSSIINPPEAVNQVPEVDCPDQIVIAVAELTLMTSKLSQVAANSEDRV